MQEMTERCTFVQHSSGAALGQTMNVFETPRFRVQITGKSAWLEVKERTGWVFRNQHTLPLAPDALGQAEELSGLRAAIEDFEQTRHGDSRLREALTGVRAA